MWSFFDAHRPTVPTCVTTDCQCGGELKVDDNMTTCSECGLMYPSIDQKAEWRYYNDGDNPTRCGMPINPLLKESSFGCKVLCEGSSSYEMRRIRRYTEWQSMPYKEKSMYDEFQHITTMATIAGIPKMIIDEACKYHKQIAEKQTFRGDNRDGIIAASIYIACRVEKYPRTARDIANIFHLDPASATKGCKNAMTIINTIEEGKKPLRYTNATPQTFVVRYCSKLGVDADMSKIAEFISLQIEKHNLIPENTPHSVAAGIIYFVSQEFGVAITKQDIRLISDISEVTINKCFKKIDSFKHQLLPPQIYEKYKRA
jgi:transcription initiation factor TFIIB